MNYKTFSDMSKDIFNSMDKIPKDIDLIIAIPRSGLFPAQIISNLIHKPMTVLDDFLDKKIYSCGLTRTIQQTSFEKIKKILVVDDTILTGNQILKVKEKLNIFHHIQFIYLSVYASNESIKKIDIYCKICHSPRVFEWNIFNSWIITNSCFDIDGLLCKDPTQCQNDDGYNYINFITNVQPLLNINFVISKIVTTRLQKYREQTEQWLTKNNFKYKSLIMLNLPNKEERKKKNMYGKFKGQIYKHSKQFVFFESNIQQAKCIKSISNKDVFCSQIMNFV